MPFKVLKTGFIWHSYQYNITSIDANAYDLTVNLNMNVNIEHKKALIFQGFLLFECSILLGEHSFYICNHLFELIAIHKTDVR